ncbi:FHA domain-containing protein [Setomelanomma holmii]|uniref:RING-type E3 ubiquitin transferase n=1 Tax=Setomelanomma holmii TaxID=210430 RepID=A0A9P4LI21_9PLEO|nr:FHA domain-containing protein [Setomelanomma holmii]
MTRNRAETAAPGLTVRNNAGPTPAAPGPSNMESHENATDGAPAVKHLPSIRFIPHQDPRAGRPSLQFPTITRTLPDESAVIRVGRYSERDNAPETPASTPSAAAVGFKSKVVSRKHCELWCKEGSWYIKDVKSSSGTFLNHIRLSQPNVESKPFRIKDGDIIQLGIDFRGGEEMIFRCVKIRVECNRGWQQGLNKFNKQTHQRLRNLAKSKQESDTASTHTSECAICLMSIAPCQSLFVAPCSHVWHYRCIRPILNGPTWPNFLCPNCRAVADLEEEVEDPADYDWEEEVDEANGDSTDKVDAGDGDRHVTPRGSTVPMNAQAQVNSQHDEGGVSLSTIQQGLSNMNIADQTAPEPQTPERRAEPPASSVTQPVTINVSGANEFNGLSPLYPNAVHGLTPDRVHDGPMTPRNDAGPFVLDGSAGRAAGNRLRDASPGSDSASTHSGNGPAPQANGTASSGAPSLPPVRFD